MTPMKHLDDLDFEVDMAKLPDKLREKLMERKKMVEAECVLNLDLDTHRHKCEKCKTIWEHPDRCSSTYSPNHSCPKCGEENGYKYWGKGKTDFVYMREGQYENTETREVVSFNLDGEKIA